MKKYLFLLFVFVAGILHSYSQDNAGLTQEELKFRNLIEQFLKEEGYQPTIDNSDNSVNFKKDGDLHWITVEGSRPSYIRIHRNGFSLEGTNRKIMLEACNHANRNKRCGKATISDQSVGFTIEFYCQSIDMFKKGFNNNISALSAVRAATQDYYNEHDVE